MKGDAITVTNPFKAWRYKGLEVLYRDNLEGGGTSLAAPFVAFVKRAYPGRRFSKVFEWCAGPGFIGLSLLHEDMCDRLCLADINGEAIECVEETVRRNGLEARVSYYRSDNFDAIPDHEVFDLVVANPPNFCGLNPAHPEYAELKDDLRPNDPAWAIHRRFYSQIGEHLVPGAQVLVSEMEPTLTEVQWLDEPAWDVRKQPPLLDFQAMIAGGGLTYLKTVPFVEDQGTVSFMVISMK